MFFHYFLCESALFIELILLIAFFYYLTFYFYYTHISCRRTTSKKNTKYVLYYHIYYNIIIIESTYRYNNIIGTYIIICVYMRILCSKEFAAVAVAPLKDAPIRFQLLCGGVYT